MAIILGANSLIDIAFPAGIDTALLKQYDRETGVSNEQIISAVIALIGEVNENLRAVYGGMLYFTERADVLYRQGAGERTETPRSGEFSYNDAVRSGEQGHMLPRYDYEDNLQLTKMFKRRGDLELLRYNLELICERWVNRVDKEIWTRALTNTEEAVGGGYSTGWAIGTGTNINYIPPEYRGNTFDATHTHYNFHDANSVTWTTAIDEAMLDLRHHGHTGTLSLWISQADVGTFTALSNMSRLTSGNIILVGGNTSSPVRYSRGDIDGVPGELVGYWDGQWGQAEVRYHPRIPTKYAFLTKSYGVDDPRNGLAVRVDPEPYGFGLKVEPMLTPTLTPKVERLYFEGTHGVGVGQRLNGVAIFRDSGAGSYTNPTIS